MKSVLTFTSPLANQSLASHQLYVPSVPMAISHSLVASRSLAMSLANSANQYSHLTLEEFESIQIQRSELRNKADECANALESLLNACVTTASEMFMHLTSYLRLQGRWLESDANLEADPQNVHLHDAKTSIEQQLERAWTQVHAYADTMGLQATSYVVDGEIHPELLLDACMKRIQVLQQSRVDNIHESLEMEKQIQRGLIFSAAATCLKEICQEGLDNQLSFENPSQTQEDVLATLDSFVELPFSGNWPVLCVRVNTSKNTGSIHNVTLNNSGETI